MNSANDSVIICESPSPNSRKYDSVSSYRKRLRSSDVPKKSRFTLRKSLLDTLYESPLEHLRRNLTSNDQLDRDIDVVRTVSLSPNAKRRMITNKSQSCSKANDSLLNLNASVICISDIKPKAVVELGLSDVETNDVIEVSKKKRGSMSSNALSPGSSKTRKRKRNERKESKDNVKTGNDENHNGQIVRRASSDADGEIEVVWASSSTGDSTNQATSSALDKIAFQDTLGSLSRFPLQPPECRVDLGKKVTTNFKRDRQKNNSKNTKLLNKKKSRADNKNLREIIIDGCNIAMGHSIGNTFSVKGLKIVIDYFKKRGHTVKAFVPQNQRTRGRDLLEKLHREGTVVFTPSRDIAGKRITPYDDRYILDYATKCKGIVVSSDQYRDLWLEKPQWRDTIENRLLTPTFVDDYLMFPEDPLGRNGPTLDEFLRHN